MAGTRCAALDGFLEVVEVSENQIGLSLFPILRCASLFYLLCFIGNYFYWHIVLLSRFSAFSPRIPAICCCRTAKWARIYAEASAGLKIDRAQVRGALHGCNFHNDSVHILLHLLSGVLKNKFGQFR